MLFSWDALFIVGSGGFDYVLMLCTLVSAARFAGRQ